MHAASSSTVDGDTCRIRCCNWRRNTTTNPVNPESAAGACLCTSAGTAPLPVLRVMCPAPGSVASPGLGCHLQSSRYLTGSLPARLLETTSTQQPCSASTPPLTTAGSVPTRPAPEQGDYHASSHALLALHDAPLIPLATTALFHSWTKPSRGIHMQTLSHGFLRCSFNI